MNLWTFVLMGFLAQASNATLEFSKAALSDLVKREMSKALLNLKGSSISSPTMPEKILNVADVSIDSMDYEYNDGEIGSLWASTSITIKGAGFTDVRIRFKGNQEMKMSLQNEVPNLKATTLKWPLFTITILSPLGEISLSESSEVASSAPALKTMIEKACDSAISSINGYFQLIKSSFYYSGNNCYFQVPKIQHLPNSIVFYLTLVMNTAQGAKTLNLNSDPVATSALQTRWTYACSFSQDFISQFMNIFWISYVKTLSEAESQEFQIFPEAPGQIQIQQIQPFDSQITPEESKATAPVQASIMDKAGNQLRQFNARLSLDVGVKASGFSVWIGSSLKLSLPTFSTDPKLSSSNTSTPEEKRVIDAAAAEAIREMQDQMQDPMPIPFLDLFASPTKPPTIIYIEGFVVWGA